MEYHASLDTLAKIITITVMVMSGYVVYQSSTAHLSPFIKIPVAAVCLIIIIISYLYAPRKYIVSNGVLVIVRPINKVCISLSDITEARLLKKNELGTMIRIFGSGGVFGYFGDFRSLRIGKVTLYTTRRDNRILITTVDDNRILISPNDTSIMNALRS